MANARGWLKGRRRPAATSVAQPQQEEIARVAYELYEQRGRADGYALDDWLKAEVIVRNQQIMAS